MAKVKTDEETTDSVNERLVLYAQLAQLFDHFGPADQFAFIEHTNLLLELSGADRQFVFTAARRLAKQ